jgi:hypothetical protein
MQRLFSYVSDIQQVDVACNVSTRLATTMGEESASRTLLLICYTCDLKDTILPLSFKYNFIPGLVIDQ